MNKMFLLQGKVCLKKMKNILIFMEKGCIIKIQNETTGGIFHVGKKYCAVIE